jgi:hypothetical protein
MCLDGIHPNSTCFTYAFYFSGANIFGNTNAQIQTKFVILIDLTKLNVGDLLIQETIHIKLLYPRQNMTLRKFQELFLIDGMKKTSVTSESFFFPGT